MKKWLYVLSISFLFFSIFVTNSMAEWQYEGYKYVDNCYDCYNTETCKLGEYVVTHENGEIKKYDHCLYVFSGIIRRDTWKWIEPEGFINAMPQQVIVPIDGTVGNTTISWSTQHCEDVEVVVFDNGIETPFSFYHNASHEAWFIQPDASYEFRLYTEDAFGNPLLLDSIVVAGIASRFISANPQDVIIPSGQELGSTTLSWCTNGSEVLQVWLSMDGGADQLVAQSYCDENVAPWIQPNHTYKFKLFLGTDHSRFIDSVTVTGYSQ